MNGAEKRVVLALEEPTSAEVRAVRAWVAEVRARARRLDRPRWAYLLLTPLGLPSRDWLEERLAERGVRIECRREIRSWPRASTAVQLKRRGARDLRRAALYEAAWAALFPRGRAEAWGVDPGFHCCLEAEKHALRAGLRNLLVELGPRPGELGVLHAFHLADLPDGEEEARRLEAALALLR